MGKIDWDEVYDDASSGDPHDEPGIDEFVQGIVANVIIPAAATLSAAAYFQATEGLRLMLATTIPLYNLMLSGKKADTKVDKEALKKMVSASFEAIYAKASGTEYEETMRQVNSQRSAKDYRVYDKKNEGTLSGQIDERYKAISAVIDRIKDTILTGIDKGFIDSSEISEMVTRELSIFNTELLHYEAMSLMMKSFEEFKETKSKKSRLPSAIAEMVEKTKDFTTPEAFFEAKKAKNCRIESKDVIIIASYTKSPKDEVEVTACNNMFPAHTIVSGRLDTAEISKFWEEWGDE
jgi:hypothetical protein